MRVNACQYWAGEYHPERVKRLEADRVDGKTENFMMHVVDGKEVQRCWHLGVENVKHHRFEHQDKGDKHFIAPGFIQLECLTKEDDGDDDGENNQHQIGDFYVVHQPCAYEDHHHAAK